MTLYEQINNWEDRLSSLRVELPADFIVLTTARQMSAAWHEFEYHCSPYVKGETLEALDRYQFYYFRIRFFQQDGKIYSYISVVSKRGEVNVGFPDEIFLNKSKYSRETLKALVMIVAKQCFDPCDAAGRIFDEELADLLFCVDV